MQVGIKVLVGPVYFFIRWKLRAGRFFFICVGEINVQVGKFPKIDKFCCTFIREAKVGSTYTLKYITYIFSFNYVTLAEKQKYADFYNVSFFTLGFFLKSQAFMLCLKQIEKKWQRPVKAFLLYMLFFIHQKHFWALQKHIINSKHYDRRNLLCNQEHQETNSLECNFFPIILVDLDRLESRSCHASYFQQGSNVEGFFSKKLWFLSLHI